MNIEVIMLKTMNQLMRRVLWLLLLSLLLSSCLEDPQDKGINDNPPIQETVTRLANEGEPLAKALANSDLFSELNSYPASLIYVTKDAFNTYLAANNLSEAEFLASPKLEAFLGTLIIPSASIGSRLTETGTFETSAGTSIVTSNKSEYQLGGNVELTINGVPATICSLSVPKREDASGTICFVTEPPSSFTW